MGSRSLLYPVAFALLLSALAFPQLTGAQKALSEMCLNIRSLLPMVALLMFVFAGTVYAAGQVLGAETRARANVWSTAMLVGGIIGLIIGASAKFLVVTFAQFNLGTGESSLFIENIDEFC